ncbi:MAG: hypothetical protein WC466_08475 [Candidatus Izemoplasmatales bacterium]
MEIKYPEKWLKPFREIESGKLAKDEQLASFLIFGIINKTTMKEENHALFAVVKKGNKALGRVVYSSMHPNSKSFAFTGASEFAEYPVEDVDTLIKETQEAAINFAVKMHQENIGKDIDLDKPMFGLIIRENASLEGIVEDLSKIDNNMFEIPKQIALELLGLNDLTADANRFNNLMANIPVLDPILIKSEFVKISEEQELIKKYGFRKIQKLAQKINYCGEIVNKQKQND